MTTDVVPNDGSKSGRRHKSAAREYIEAFGFALIFALVMRASIVQAYVIPTGSMIPTLQVGDHILVNKIRFGLRVPDSVLGFKVPGLPLGQYLFRLQPVQRGDVVVLVSPVDPSMDLIKRVIAIPGDTVTVKNGQFFLNGRATDDPHAHFTVPDQDRTPIQIKNPRDNFGVFDAHSGEVWARSTYRRESCSSWATIAITASIAVIGASRISTQSRAVQLWSIGHGIARPAQRSRRCDGAASAISSID